MCPAHLQQAKCALLLLALVSLYDKQAACTDTETEKRPTVARGPGEYSSMATSVILESTWCNYPVAGTQRSRPLPSSTLEPKAPLFMTNLVIRVPFAS